MASFANQRKVTTHKPPFDGHFLQVGKTDWMTAYQTLRRGTFGLYLYLCGHQNNYAFYLSSADVQKQLGISDSTYRRAIEELKENGYITIGKNEHDFHFHTKSRLMPSVMEDGDVAAAPVISEPAATELPVDAGYVYKPSAYSSLYGWEN